MSGAHLSCLGSELALWDVFSFSRYHRQFSRPSYLHLLRYAHLARDLPGESSPNSELSRDVPQTAASLPSDADFGNCQSGNPSTIYSNHRPSRCHRRVSAHIDLEFFGMYPPAGDFPSDERQIPQSLGLAIAEEPGGALVDKTTGTELSYLYWEAM